MILWQVKDVLSLLQFFSLISFFISLSHTVYLLLSPLILHFSSFLPQILFYFNTHIKREGQRYKTGLIQYSTTRFELTQIGHLDFSCQSNLNSKVTQPESKMADVRYFRTLVNTFCSIPTINI